MQIKRLNTSQYTSTQGAKRYFVQAREHFKTRRRYCVHRGCCIFISYSYTYVYLQARYMKNEITMDEVDRKKQIRGNKRIIGRYPVHVCRCTADEWEGTKQKKKKAPTYLDAMFSRNLSTNLQIRSEKQLWQLLLPFNWRRGTEFLIRRSNGRTWDTNYFRSASMYENPKRQKQ